MKRIIYTEQYTFYYHFFFYLFANKFLHSVTNLSVAGRTLFAEIRCRRHSVFERREKYNMRCRRRIENKYN